MVYDLFPGLSVKAAQNKWKLELNSAHVRKDQVRANDKEGRDIGLVT